MQRRGNECTHSLPRRVNKRTWHWSLQQTSAPFSLKQQEASLSPSEHATRGVG